MMKFSHTQSTPFLPNVQNIHDRLETTLKMQHFDAMLVSSQDAFLSEYNTAGNNQRYALSAFTGSTGDGIFLTREAASKLGVSARFLLFVDGRYHLQADLETSKELVSVVKVPLNETVEGAILHWLKEAGRSGSFSLAIDAERTTWQRFESISNISKETQLRIGSVESSRVNEALNLPGWSIDRPIEALDRKYTGRSLVENLDSVTSFLETSSGGSKKTALITVASDDAAWVLNARGYHMPHTSSFLAYTFILDRDVVLFLPKGVEKCAVNVPLEHKNEKGSARVHVVRENFSNLKDLLKQVAPDVSKIAFNSTSMNAFLPEFAKSVWPQAEVQKDVNAVEVLRCSKTPEELNSLRDSYLRSSRAIAKTMRWIKNNAQNSKTKKMSIHEVDVVEKISEEYSAEGALELSFRTIAGTGSNGAIIHYGTPSVDCYLKHGDLFLLDSGAYYEPGFATDCTRVVFCGSTGVAPESWQKEIYTLTVKAWVAGLTAEFQRDAQCIEVDAVVRNVCKHSGYDYAHGTGHGIGIHVHESGIRLHPNSKYRFTENAALSIEPGIYLNGRGGVRIENVVFVKQAEANAQKFCFENIIFVGLDWDVIDLQMLTEDEKIFLSQYEKKCLSLGTHVSKCPLL